jgi:hypothetical protein
MAISHFHSFWGLTNFGILAWEEILEVTFTHLDAGEKR